MSMNENERREFESLVSALCDGAIDQARHEQLDQMLRDSEDCRRIYLQFVDMHARLTTHPNLMTDIPLAQVDANAVPLNDVDDQSNTDDQVVLELARTSLEQFTNDSERARKRRKYLMVGKWVGLTLAILLAVFGWQAYDHWYQQQHGIAIASIKGEVTVTRAGGSSSNLAVGDYLYPGQRLRTGGDDSLVTLKYADGTKIVVCFNSAIQIPKDQSDKTFQLLAGTIDVDAAPQPPDRPLVFKTEHARYVVIGTRFRLYREEEATRLELDEGKVRVEQRDDDQGVDVTAGQVAVAASPSGPVEITQLATGKGNLVRTLQKAGEAVTFSEGGEFFATSDWQRGFKTWKLDDDEPVLKLRSRLERTSGFALTSDDAMLVQANNRGRDGAAMIWKLGKEKGKKIRLPGKSVRSRALSPDGHFLAESGEEGMRIFAIDTAKGRLSPIAEFSQPGKAWCMSLSESAQLAAAGFWNRYLRVYDVETAEVVFEHRFTHTPTKLAISRDGKRLAVFTRMDGLILIDLATGHQQSLWAAGVADVSCLKFTNDGTRILAGLNDGTARMWSFDGRALLVIDVGHTPKDIAWSEINSVLATAGGSVNLWKCEIP